MLLKYTSFFSLINLVPTAKIAINELSGAFFIGRCFNQSDDVSVHLFNHRH